MDRLVGVASSMQIGGVLLADREVCDSTFSPLVKLFCTTRLETRTKESNMSASRRVRNL